MSLQSLYESFLASPRAVSLSDDSSLNYITTLTTFNTASTIIKHLSANQKVLEKKEEKVLSCIEGKDALCLDVETTLEFLSGGGAYLPGLDDNFLTSRIVTFPIVHVVHFDFGKKIRQIRLYWDQGSLLKLVDVIGARARNWPICDGKDQARLIALSAASAAKGHGTAQASISNSKGPTGNVVSTNRVGSPKKNADHGPHRSFSLSAPEEVGQGTDYAESAVAPRVSAKPLQRDYQEFFPGEESASSLRSEARAPSPAKENYPAPKGGASKSYQQSRIFDIDDGQDHVENWQQSPEKQRKADPKKYSHFDFGDGPEGTTQQQGKFPGLSKIKHQSQWEFNDFMTPQKHTLQRARGQSTRQYGFDEDDGKIDNSTKNSNIAPPHRDVKTNFELNDEPTPVADRHPVNRPLGQSSNKGQGLYQDTVSGDIVEPSQGPNKKNHPLSTVTNLKDRRNDLNSQFEMSDNSPYKVKSQQNRPIPENRSNAIKMMDSQWDSQWQVSDQTLSPNHQTADEKYHNTSHDVTSSKDKENHSVGGDKLMTNTGIKTGGDGMGGKKGAAKGWGVGDESDEEHNRGKFLARKKQLAPKDDAFWDF